jgi:UDP-GlcNAc:undecaprenyl-phosphate GlcNAc-1-phosphate transferase
MILPLLSLCGASFVIAWVGTFLVRRAAIRVGFVDKPGHRKIHSKPIALGGGVAIFVAFAGPILTALAALHANSNAAYAVVMVGAPTAELAQQRANQIEFRRALHAGVLDQTPLALSFVGGCLVLHLMGLWDDRRAMGPYSKLLVQLGVAAGLVAFNPDLRAVTALGPVASFALTVLWITAVTNAFNFLDNMDGLSAGVACVCAACFLVTAVTIGQWFVAASLALLSGRCSGFLCFNFAPASIFMGDGGSLVVGLRPRAC